MAKKSLNTTLSKIKDITYVANPINYSGLKNTVCNRDAWPYDISNSIFVSLQLIYGKQRLDYHTHIHAYEEYYTKIGVSPAMQFKAEQILKFLQKVKQKNYTLENILRADVQIQKNYIKIFDYRIEKIISAYPSSCAEKDSVISAINSIKNYDILSELTYDYMMPKWSGHINPWANLEFLQNGAVFYDKNTEPKSGISPDDIKEQALINLQKQSEQFDASAEAQIRRIKADNIETKKKLGIDPDSIYQTADNKKLKYEEEIEKAFKILGTKDRAVAERFAYHFFFKTK